MNWPLVTVDSIKAKVPYACVGGPFGSNLTSKHYVNEGVPVIRGQNLTGANQFNEEGFVFVSAEKADALRPNSAYRGDLIFTQRGTLGQVGLIPSESNFERYIVSQSQMKLTVDSERVDARYIYQYFRLPSTVQAILNRTITAGVPHINLGILKALEIPLPPLAIQRRISDVSQNYDDLIETNHRRISLLEESARLLYREWFVNLRFPGHELVKWRDGLPEGWSLVPLSVFAQVNRASLSAKSAPDVIQYIDIASVETGVIREVTEMPFAEAPGRARRIVQHGDVIWSCVRPNRKSFSLIWEPDDNWVVSTGFAVLSAKSIPFSYLYLATTSDEFAAFLSNRATGAAYPAVTAKDFEASEVLVPSPDVLKDFHERCEQSFCLRHNLLKQNIALAKARDELLPKLMSGAIRV